MEAHAYLRSALFVFTYWLGFDYIIVLHVDMNNLPFYFIEFRLWILFIGSDILSFNVSNIHWKTYDRNDIG